MVIKFLYTFKILSRVGLVFLGLSVHVAIEAHKFADKSSSEFELSLNQTDSILSAKNIAMSELLVEKIYVLSENVPPSECAKKIFKIVKKIVKKISSFKELKVENVEEARALASELRNNLCLLGCAVALHPEKKYFEKNFIEAVDLAAEIFAWQHWLTRDRKKLLQKMRWLRLRDNKNRLFSFIGEVAGPPLKILASLVVVHKGLSIILHSYPEFSNTAQDED